MIELYEFPPTRSNRVKWALLELGLDYTSHLIDFRKGEHKAQDYKSIHPLGMVPVCKTDHYSMFESIAILMQLLDEHSEKGLAPEPGSSKRAEYYQWCVFAGSELDHTLSDIMVHTMHLPEERRVAEIAQRGIERFDARAGVLSNVLNDREFLLGSEFSGADIAIGYNCNWAAYTHQLEKHKVLMEYYERLEKRPAFQKVFMP